MILRPAMSSQCNGKKLAAEDRTEIGTLIGATMR